MREGDKKQNHMCIQGMHVSYSQPVDSNVQRNKLTFSVLTSKDVIFLFNFPLIALRQMQFKLVINKEKKDKSQQ